jgi:anti-sigma factor RsiW
MPSVEHPLDPEELNEYVDGELPLERRADVEVHLAACGACQQIVRDLRGVSRDLAAWSIETSPDALRARSILNNAAGGELWRMRWIPSWAAVPAIGRAAIAVLLLALVPRQRNNAPAVSAAVPGASIIGLAGAEEGRPAPARAAPSMAPEVPETAIRQQTTRGPRVIRTATLHLVPKDFDAARAAVDRIVANAGGYLGTMNATGTRPSPRTLTATVNVPAARLDETIAALRALGEVVQESQNASDVTEQLVDLEARLANSRNTERRMNELLRTRTGKLSEVLEAEREVTRIREEIERLDAQRKSLDDRVAYSAISVQLDEIQKSSMDLGPLPLTTRIRNAFVEGVRGAFSSAVEALLVVLQVAPALLFWGLLLGVPIWRFARRRARATA